MNHRPRLKEQYLPGVSSSRVRTLNTTVMEAVQQGYFNCVGIPRLNPSGQELVASFLIGEPLKDELAEILDRTCTSRIMCEDAYFANFDFAHKPGFFSRSHFRDLDFYHSILEPQTAPILEVLPRLRSFLLGVYILDKTQELGLTIASSTAVPTLSRFWFKRLDWVA